MKQICTSLACGFAMLLGGASADAAQLSLQIMKPESIKLSVQSWENPLGEEIPVTMGVNVVEYDEALMGQLVIEGVAPYQLVGVAALGAYDSPLVTFNRATITLNSENNGHFYNVSVLNLDEARTSSVTLNILDENYEPSSLLLSRGSDDISITNNQQVIPFNPDTETRFTLRRSDWKTICDVKKNGETVLASFGLHSFDVEDGDNIVVTLDFPDKDIPVTINYPEGLKDVVRSVMVNGIDAENWDSSDFKIHSGLNVMVNLDNISYKLEGVSINGIPQENVYNNINFIPGLDPVVVDVFARKFGNYTATVNIDHPERVKVYPGQYPESDAFELTGNSTLIEVPETSPFICMDVDSNYLISSVTDDNGANLPFLNLQSKSLKVTDGMVINITTEERAFDSSFAIYLDTEEGVTSKQYVCRQDMVYFQLHEGYNVVPFIAAEQPQYLIQIYCDNPGVYYQDGVQQDVYNPKSYYWQGIPEDGMVIKAYFKGEPSEHNITVDIEDSLADKVHVVTDMIKPLNDFTNLSLHKGSHIGLSMTEGVAAKVAVDGVEITPDEKGMHNIYVTDDHNISVKASEVPSGIEELEVTQQNGEVYNLQGIRVRSNASNLPAGIYIMNGKKITVK